LKTIATVSSLKVVEYAKLVTSCFLKAHATPIVAKSFQKNFKIISIFHIPCETIPKELCDMSCEIL